MDCVSSIKQCIHGAEHPANGYKNNCLEQVGVALYAPLGSVVKLYEKQKCCLAKAALAVAGVFAMAIALVGALFKKFGECCNGSIKQEVVTDPSLPGIKLTPNNFLGLASLVATNELQSQEQGAAGKPKNWTWNSGAVEAHLDRLDLLFESPNHNIERREREINLVHNALRELPEDFLLRNATRDNRIAERILKGIAAGKNEYLEFAETCALADKLGNERSSFPLLSFLGEIADEENTLDRWLRDRNLLVEENNRHPESNV